MKYKFKIAVKCLPILFSIFLFSCSSSSNNPQNASQQPQQTESAGQIVDKYVNTLTTAQDKAKKAAGAENKRVEEENKAVQEEEKWNNPFWVLSFVFSFPSFEKHNGYFMN